MGDKRQRVETRHQQARPTPSTPKQSSRDRRKADNLSGRTSEAARQGLARRPQQRIAGSTIWCVMVHRYRNWFMLKQRALKAGGHWHGKRARNG
jgi:hypothetical protein